MAKKANSPAAKKKAARKSASPRASAAEAPKPHVTNVKTKRKVPLDFSTARHLPEGDRRIPKSKVVIAFLVDDEEGNEIVYHCLPGSIPAEARAALG